MNQQYINNQQKQISNLIDKVEALTIELNEVEADRDSLAEKVTFLEDSQAPLIAELGKAHTENTRLRAKLNQIVELVAARLES